MDAARGLAEVPRGLRPADGGDASALQELFAVLPADLKQLAHARLRTGRDSGAVLPQNRPAFFAYVGKVMRSVVLDCVRGRRAKKRGGNDLPVMLTAEVPGKLAEERLLALDEALNGLERLAPDLSRLVEMRYFVGLSIPEISEITGTAVRTLERDWGKARGLLRTLMAERQMTTGSSRAA